MARGRSPILADKGRLLSFSPDAQVDIIAYIDANSGCDPFRGPFQISVEEVLCVGFEQVPDGSHLFC